MVREQSGMTQGNELLVTGGVYVDTYEALLGDVPIKIISEFVPNITIIGVSGLRWEEGVFCHGAEEAAIKKLLWTKKTDIRLIATDWTKIGKRDAHSFGRVEQLGVNAKQAVVVTCNPPDNEEPKRIEEFEREVRAMEKGNIHVVRLDIP
jgi:DeoR/GlpR family transcriptional regulator of sugar metabolism